MEEWFEYGGEPYYFKISVDINNKPYYETTEQSLIDLITANKNVRSKLENLIINILSGANQSFTGCMITSEEVTV